MLALYSAYAAADHDAMDELLAVDFVGHGIGPGLTDDAEGMKQSSVAMHAALTDCSNKIEQMIAEGDMVAVRSPLAQFTAASSSAYLPQANASRCLASSGTGCRTTRSLSSGASTKWATYSERMPRQLAS